MLKKKTNLVDGSMYNEKNSILHFRFYFFRFMFNCNHVRLLTCVEYIMITKDMIKKTKKLMQKHLPNSDKFQTDEFAKSYLEIFLKAKEKVEKRKS